MTMRSALVAVVAIAAFLSPSTSTANNVITKSQLNKRPGKYIEPTIQRHVGILPQSVCDLLIELGEKTTFHIDYESIDTAFEEETNRTHIPAQTINVYGDGDEDDEIIRVLDRPIWNVLEPYIPKITSIIKNNRNQEEFRKLYPNDPDREPLLQWIFYRKYSPDTARNSLTSHRDVNMNTLNIEIGTNYAGGGFFYIKPLLVDGKYYYNRKWDKQYDFTDTLKRENTSDIIFPGLQAGDAIFYNYTVKHGVAPIELGERYSMAFFFDMDNPAMQDDDDEEEEELEEGEFKVELYNGWNDVIDIVQVIGKEYELTTTVFENVAVNESLDFYGFEGDRLRALQAGGEEILAEFVIKPDRLFYRISSQPVDSMSADEL